MTVAEWLALARADAGKRGLPELMTALDGLAKATEQLRAADWNDPSTPSGSSLEEDAEVAHPSLGSSKDQDGGPR